MVFHGNESVMRIGYIIARKQVDIPWAPGRIYRGIDRLPYIPRLLFESAARPAAWHRYLDAWEDGHISRNLELTKRIAGELEEEGNEVEVIYAEAIEVPATSSLNLEEPVGQQRDRSLAWLKSRSTGIGPPPGESSELGLDVSSPIPSFHSIIIQPGLTWDSGRASMLNNAGLVGDERSAIELMDEANSMRYDLSFFSVIRVYAV